MFALCLLVWEKRFLQLAAVNFFSIVESKSVVDDVISMTIKITEHKLTGSNYLDWSKNVRVYLWSSDKNDHLTQDPPTNDTKKTWMREDVRLFL